MQPIQNIPIEAVPQPSDYVPSVRTQTNHQSMKSKGEMVSSHSHHQSDKLSYGFLKEVNIGSGNYGVDEQAKSDALSNDFNSVARLTRDGQVHSASK